jgi:hypothetical protein
VGRPAGTGPAVRTRRRRRDRGRSPLMSPVRHEWPRVSEDVGAGLAGTEDERG